MPSVNVYVPEDLKARLDEAQLSLSEIARAAWEREMEMAQIETEEIRVKVGEEELRFDGSLVASSPEDDLDVYVTDQGNVVGIEIEHEKYWTVPVSDLDADDVASWFRHSRDAYEEARRTFGVPRIVNL